MLDRFGRTGYQDFMLHRASFQIFDAAATDEIASLVTSAPRAAAEPSAVERIQARLAQIDDRLRVLREMHQLQGDAMAGRFVASLEAELDAILIKVAGTRSAGALGSP
jgi:hypothetical protein